MQQMIRNKIKRRNIRHWNLLYHFKLHMFIILIMYFYLIQHKENCLKKLNLLFKQLQMVKILVYLHMVKLVQEKHIQWKDLTQINYMIISIINYMMFQEFYQELLYLSRMKSNAIKNNITKTCQLKSVRLKSIVKTSGTFSGRILAKLTNRNGDMWSSKLKVNKRYVLDKLGLKFKIQLSSQNKFKFLHHEEYLNLMAQIHTHQEVIMYFK